MNAEKDDLDEQMKKSLHSLKSYAAGKTTLRTTVLASTGERAVFKEALPEAQVRRARLAGFKAMRSGLGLTQLQLAAALRVSASTLRGWEAGKPIPDMAFLLTEVLHDIPAVRKKLLVVA